MDIINGKICKERLSGKLGILATSATGLKDIRPTPVEDRMPGVEIHANLIDTVISAILYYTSNKNAKSSAKYKIIYLSSDYQTHLLVLFE